ncbi:MAG: urea ABC transporter permease subunit UrtB [Proteobacteria bacterium]|nr:urea ABC transporter permease subunit UrtB [Pseudomonadota bacterium]
MLRSVPIFRLLALAAIVLNCGLAIAGPYEDALKRFSADSFGETEIAIKDMAASGAQGALPALEALQAGRLSVAGDTVFYLDGNGQATDAATGSRLAGIPADGKVVRLNNRLRRALENALGGLTLFSKDPARRLQAAEALFKSKDTNALPGLEKAISAEPVPAVKKALVEAEAAIMLARPANTAEALGAIRTLRERGDQEALAQLNVAATSLADPAVRSAAEAAVAAIAQRQKLLSVVQNVWYGLSLGSVLLLAAIGLSITFGVMGIINMAHGEMVMLGAYATFLTQEMFRAYAPGWFDWSLAAAIPVAFLLAAAVGVVIERGIIRFLYGRPLETLLATFGVSLILQQSIRTLFGPTNREVTAPAFMSGNFDLFGLSIAYGRMWIIVFTLAVFAFLLFLLKATPLGLRMRAVTQNRRMAASMGIRTAFVDSATFALGSGIAGVAGVALSQIDNVSPNLGQSYIIDSFMVVVFGGVGNLWGTLVSAFALGIGNKFLEPVAGAVLAKIAILVCLILFIQKRPSGLFALKGRAVEQ